VKVGDNIRVKRTGQPGAVVEIRSKHIWVCLEEPYWDDTGEYWLGGMTSFLLDEVEAV